MVLIFIIALTNNSFAQFVYSNVNQLSQMDSQTSDMVKELGRDRSHSIGNREQLDQITHKIDDLRQEAQKRAEQTRTQALYVHKPVLSELEQKTREFLNYVVGADPIGGLTRSSYEWLTAKNLVTQLPLTSFEHGMAFAGIVTLGGESVVSRLFVLAKSASHIFNIYQIESAMIYGRNLLKTQLGDVLSKIRSFGGIHSADGFKAFNREAPVKFRHNQVFARVVPKEFAEDIISGKINLSRDGIAFITPLNDLKGYDSDPISLAKRLSLYEDEALTELRDLRNHVVIKFRLIELKQLSIPDPSKYKGYIPTGETLGGASEFIIHSDALQRGLIDPSSMSIEELFL